MRPLAWMAAVGLSIVPSERGEADYSGAFDAAPVLSWRVPLPGPGVASASHSELGAPLLHGDHVYVGSAGADALYLLDRRSGREVGQLATKGPVHSAPLIVEDRLYFSDGAGHTWCYPVGGAAPLWSHESGAPILSTPTIDLEAGVAYVANVDNVVVALDLETGELQWRYAHRLDATRQVELELFGKPAPRRAGELVLAGFSDGRLVALDAETGEPRWQRTIGEGEYPDLIASALPVEEGKAALVAGFSEPLVLVDLEGRSIRWRREEGGPNAAALGLGDEGEAVVLHGGVDGQLRRYDLRTGELAWSWDSGTGTSLTTPILTEGGVLVGASGGSVYLVDEDSGDLRWSWDPALHPSGVSASPAVEGRQAVVVTNAGFIMSFVSPAPEPDWQGLGIMGPDRP